MNFVEDINPFIEIVMKNNLTYNVFFATMIAFSCYTTQAQDSDRMSKSEKIENTKRNENFKTLKNLGYSEKEIYEDYRERK